jgi:hypothetical protein
LADQNWWPFSSVTAAFGHFRKEIERARALPLLVGVVASLITAGRRECWGSQTGEAEGHRNNAVPFCFVPDTFSRCTAFSSG